MNNHIQEHLMSYTKLLKNDVDIISQQLEEINLLNSINDPRIIHKGLEQLVSYQLDTSWVVVPRQYKDIDWYLLTMHRFLSLSGEIDYDLLTHEDREELIMVFKRLQVPAIFQFSKNSGDAGGVYFVEMKTKQKLFYWSLERKELLFNAHALTDLLVSNYRNKDTANDIRNVSDILRSFGRYLEKTFEYKVDYNILETMDTYLYNLVQTKISDNMLDNLFVFSAESEYFMQAINNGAAMMLNNDVEMRIFYNQNSKSFGGKKWHFQVIDGQNTISWLDILLDYDFIGTWYLKECLKIEIDFHKSIFYEGSLPVKGTSMVEILQPRSM